MKQPSEANGFRHVVCPIDFSRHSRLALKYAARIAAQHDARLTALVANDPLLASAAAAATRDRGMLTATTMSELRRFVNRTLGMGAAVSLRVFVGDAGQQIDKFARRLGADLIVMGTHGLSGPRKWFFGSTTEAVLRRATVPVLTVPATVRAAAQSLREFPQGTLLAPIDLEGTERADAGAAFQAARRLGLDVRLLHVVKPLRLPPWIGPDGADLDRQRVRTAEKRLRELVGNAPLRTTWRVVVGEPAHEIAKAAATSKVGLIALTLKKGGVFGPRQGSVTYRVLCSGVAPVLALPAPRR